MRDPHVVAWLHPGQVYLLAVEQDQAILRDFEDSDTGLKERRQLAACKVNIMDDPPSAHLGVTTGMIIAFGAFRIGLQVTVHTRRGSQPTCRGAASTLASACPWAAAPQRNVLFDRSLRSGSHFRFYGSGGCLGAPHLRGHILHELFCKDFRPGAVLLTRCLTCA